MRCFEDIHAMTLRKLDALVLEHFHQFPMAECYVKFVFLNLSLLDWALTYYRTLFKIACSCRA